MKNKYHIGLNLGHNSSIAIVDNNQKLIFATDIDRYTKISYDHGYYEDQIERALHYLKIKKKDVLSVNFNQVWIRDEKISDFTQRKLFPEAINKKKLNKIRTLDLTNLNKKKIINIQNKFENITSNFDLNICSHHACHAASAAYTSNFKKKYIYVLDAFGDGINHSEWILENGEMKNVILEENYPNYPHMWELISRVIFNEDRKDVGRKLNGYFPSKGPGKIMALAAKSDPKKKYILNLKELFSDKKLYKIELNNHKYLKQKIFQKIGIKEKKFDWGSKDLLNIASALQFLTNEFIYNKIRYNKFKNISFAGGLALNCVATSYASNKVNKRVYVPPFPGDSGISVGAAYLGKINNDKKNLIKNFFVKKKINQRFTPYIGYSFNITSKEINNILKRYSLNKLSFNIKKLSSINAAKTIARHINNKKIVAVFRGRAEFGPRALCNRSILSNAFDKKTKSEINKLKYRENFRPVAPSVLKDCSKKIFENILVDSPFMTQCQKIKYKFYDKLGGLNHYDFTARPQLIEKYNIFMHNVLKNIKKQNGIGIVGNTSFNIKGPIVETPEDAIKTFVDSKINYLILNNFLIEKDVKTK
mgnify:CR=1 FL=1|tara:strand:+ start:16489 stop:18258 length:1770 start_codon:yes stop_codon:yes gene_type:complete